MDTPGAREEDGVSSGLVLVVEDEGEIAAILEGFLRQGGFRTERASDGEAALELFRAARPDLVLLDVMLPRRDGVEVLKAIRRQDATPVILLTARSAEIDKLLGLELGADDYITKPFRPMEVVARVRAVLRRSRGLLPGGEGVVRAGEVEVDPSRGAASLSGTPLDLTVTEFRLLRHFASNPGRVYSRAELLEAAMPESDALERVIDVHIGNLRRKLAAAGGTDLLQTVRGMGFKLAGP